MNAPRLFTGHRALLLARLIANGLAQAAGAVGMAVLIKWVFDRHIIGSEPNGQGVIQDFWATLTLTQLGVGLVMAALATGWLRMQERIDAESLGQHYAHEVRVSLFDHLRQLPHHVLRNRSRGGLFLRFVGDLTAIRQWISLGLARLGVATITTVGTLIALTFINPTLAGIVTLIFAIGAALSLLTGKAIEKAVRRVRRRRAQLAANIVDKIAQMPVVQAFGRTGYERKFIRRQSRRVKRAMEHRASVVGALRGMIHAITGLATAGALLLGAYEVAAGRASPGTVVAAMSLVAILMPPIRDLGRVYEFWHAARVSWEKLDELFSLRPLLLEDEAARPLKPEGGRIEFCDVHVKGALNGISATVEPASVVAITGPNGSGKSTLLTLAARLRDPDIGQVLLDGQDIAKLSLNSLRPTIGIVSHDLPLLRGTLRMNLSYHSPGVKDAELEAICRTFGLRSLLEGLPKGLDSRLSEQSLNLSLGERHRIMLIRAVLGSPQILLLDEADANLDPAAAALLESLIQSYKGTILMVTHDVRWTALADVVWQIEKGRLVDVMVGGRGREGNSVVGIRRGRRAK